MAGKINQSLDEVKECLNSQKSFIVEAGAGSGKTWTLIESIKYILEKQADVLEKTNRRVACITYTNVAKDEIANRIENNPLVLVLTIHEFLWYVIKNYQKELTIEIIKYNQTDTQKHIENLEAKLLGKTIEYSQYGRKFEKGRITHEDVLAFSSNIFANYPKISLIVTNKFPYLFIDEYQDTEERTVRLLIEQLLAKITNKIVIGFYGDSMQKIYNQGIGKIPNEYISNGTLKLITKNENFRCSKKVIALLANIRPELVQEPAGKNVEGEIFFIHCNNSNNNIVNYEASLGFLKQVKLWDMQNKTKILLLTHKGIASRLGYEKLLSVYNQLDFGREQLTNKQEIFSNFFLNGLELLIRNYKNGNYRDFIKQLGVEGFKLNFHKDKQTIKLVIESLIELRERATVAEVIKFIFENNLLTKPLRLEQFELEILSNNPSEDTKRNKKFFDDLMLVKYAEFISINDFIEDFTPYSTKHGVKGAEFENGLVVIDDASWNQYKFNDVFALNKSNLTRYERTLNLLYVCCSRAKSNLALLSLSKMDNSAMQTIQKWFGDNVFNVSHL